MEPTYENYLIKACSAREWALSRGWKVKKSLADPGDPRFGNAPVVLRDHEIVCLDRNAPFDAGSIIDCTVMLKNTTYKKATAAFVKEHGDYFERHVPFDRTYLADAVSVELEAHRKLFEWVRTRMYRPPQSLGSSRATSWLRSHRVNPETAASLVFIGDERDFNEFLDLARAINPGLQDILPGKKSDLIFIPYYRSFGRLVRMDILDPKSGKRLEAHLSHYDAAYFGLKDIDPRAAQVRITTSPWTAAALRSENKTKHPHNYYTHIVRTPETVEKTPYTRFPKGVYLHTPGTVPHELIELGPYFDKTLVADNELILPQSIAVPRDKFLLKYIAAMYNKHGGLSRVLKQFIEPLRGDSEFIAKLFKYLKRHKMKRAEAELTGWLNVDILRYSGIYVQETEYGYELIEEKTGRRRLISNFTMKLERQVMFPQSGDVFYAAHVHAGGVSIPYFCPGIQLNKPSLVAGKISSHVDSDITPAILEKKGSKFISNLWADRSTMIPKELGCDWLGWSGDRSKFFGAGWVSDRAGAAGRQTCYHPQQSLFDNFDQRGQINLKDIEAKDIPDTDTGVQDLFNATAAWIGRGYHSKPLYPVEFHDDQRTRQFLTRLFRLIGQHRTVRLNPNLRALDHEKDYPVTAYPLLAENYSAYQSDHSKLPLVLLLVKAGQNIEKEYDPHQVVTLSKLYALIMARVTCGLMAGRITFAQEDTQDRHLDLCREGAALIRGAMGWSDWCADRYQQTFLHRYFKMFNNSTISNAITANFTDQTAVISVRYTDIKRRDLIRDLESLGITAELDSKNPYKLEADLAAIKGLLDEQYGPDNVAISRDAPEQQAPELPKAKSQ